ncbi:MAG: NAD(P)H-dependent glycerol-3-phosphate dehydrogenase [bacterium]|nr:NAD(P)H-dependent glycerol-3-phosphate dehydrogenase [bacterium]
MPKRSLKNKPVKVGVIGGGAWGTALANHLAGKNHQVTLWALESEVVQSIQKKHQNPFLKGIRLHKGLKSTGDLQACCDRADFIVVAVPAQFVRMTLQKMKPFLSSRSILVSVSKGIETTTGHLLADIYREVLSNALFQRLSFLSGPSFAREVAEKHLTAVVVASTHPSIARKVQNCFATPNFRVYTTTDVIGVELGGALKNVIAIAAGIVEGLDYSDNTRSALLTGALFEMARLGIRMGASPPTFMGLSGVGDLILTCTGALSRNREVGIQIGKGKKLSQILKDRKTVAEGVATSSVIHKLARRYKLDMPICENVYEMVHKGKDPRRAINELSLRPLGKETEGL